MKKLLLLSAILLSSTTYSSVTTQTKTELAFDVLCSGKHNDGRVIKLEMRGGNKYIVYYNAGGVQTGIYETDRSLKQFEVFAQSLGYATSC